MKVFNSFSKKVTGADYNVIYYFHKEACDYESTGTDLRVVNCIIAILFLHEQQDVKIIYRENIPSGNEHVYFMSFFGYFVCSGNNISK